MEKELETQKASDTGPKALLQQMEDLEAQRASEKRLRSSLQSMGKEL